MQENVLKLIVGLGNPGKKYSKTRHNIGFIVAEELAKRYNTKLKNKLFSNAKEAHIKFSDAKAVLIQPQTFMNLSGRCVLRYANKLNAGLKNILVICDDINLKLGEIRIRPQGSSGGHNGLESIIKSLNTEGFPRLRIGIKTEEKVDDLSVYVLSDFKKGEIKKTEDSIIRATDACECWLKEGIERAMNRFNEGVRRF